jgi:DNA recombination protein RmuC
MGEMTPLFLSLAAGLVLTSLLVIVLLSVRVRARAESRLLDVSERAQRAESTVAELRAQGLDLRTELAEVRDRLAQAEQARAVAETRIEEATRHLAEQEIHLAKTRAELTDAFKALSSESLQQNNQAFLDLARASLETVHAQAAGDLTQRQQAVESLVKPLQETLVRYEEQLHQLERARQSAYGGLDDHLQRLRQETGNLAKALRAPSVRGRWGEISLRRVVELAGLSSHCDFIEQEMVEGAEGRLRPDLIVQLPAGRQIVVDAKAVLSAYLEAHDATDETQRQAAIAKHAAQVRSRMDQLGTKVYWTQFANSPEFVVLFLPGEHFLSAALEQDPGLIEDGFARRVILATPTTLIALLHAVAYGWRQEQLSEHAQQAGRLGKDLYERMAILAEHWADVGQSLEKSVLSYNRAVGSLETRVLPAARKFKELGVTSDKDVAQIEMVEALPRTLPVLE